MDQLQKTSQAAPLKGTRSEKASKAQSVGMVFLCVCLVFLTFEKLKFFNKFDGLLCRKKQPKKRHLKDPKQLSFARWILAEGRGHETFCIVHSFEKEDFLESLHPVLSCRIKKLSFYLMCVFGSSFRTLPVNLLHFFLQTFESHKNMATSAVILSCCHSQTFSALHC